jgi:Putative methyltransferase
MSRMNPAAGRGDGWSWVAWHQDYDVPGSPLAQRLAAVQAQIAAALDQAPPGPLRAVSLCAGQGRDLIGVLAGHPRGHDVTARLVELDPDNAATARELAASAGLPRVEVVLADAAEPAAYAGLVPADLVLACGVFGNIPDEDVRRTIQCLPQLCAAGGTVIWTRGRWAPDLIPQICAWFGAQGFEPLWVSDPALPFGAGAHRFTGTPAPLATGPRMFTFMTDTEIRQARGLPPRQCAEPADPEPAGRGPEPAEPS